MAVLRGSCLEMNDVKVYGGAWQYTGPTEHLSPVLMDLYEHWHRAVTQSPHYCYIRYQLNTL